MSFNIINEPWVESPFFYQILKSKKNRILKKYAIDIHEKGYCILDLNLSDKVINDVNNDIERSISTGDFRKIQKFIITISILELLRLGNFQKMLQKLLTMLF